MLPVLLLHKDHDGYSDELLCCKDPTPTFTWQLIQSVQLKTLCQSSHSPWWFNVKLDSCFKAHGTTCSCQTNQKCNTSFRLSTWSCRLSQSWWKQVLPEETDQIRMTRWAHCMFARRTLPTTKSNLEHHSQRTPFTNNSQTLLQPNAKRQDEQSYVQTFRLHSLCVYWDVRNF